ncbi:hypothetical protein LTR56_019548 [Elasticomyces elasticus]|nr:hypothetical protein LTR56_019548 [Elasticomyces elasticus]KAK3653758.1 hypothetical protein LTR22_011137 [Elasticomyces elasticus]KAK4924133.1 hypothetical protein LTR49_008652 [Elasticomyces elasticus]KAK5758481.1 hypothetical protein LTS12_011343 [Elasticomyces elasticus]
MPYDPFERFGPPTRGISEDNMVGKLLVKSCEPHRARAIKLALEEIDRHLGEYDQPEKVTAFLEKLIAEHDLKDKPKTSIDNAVQPLTADRYENILESVLANYPRQPKPGSRWNLHTRGSVLVKEEYLHLVGFQAQVASSGIPAAVSALHQNAGILAEDGQVKAKRESPRIHLKATSSLPNTAVQIQDDDYVDGSDAEKPAHKRQKTAALRNEVAADASNIQVSRPATPILKPVVLVASSAMSRHIQPPDYTGEAAQEKPKQTEKTPSKIDAVLKSKDQSAKADATTTVVQASEATIPDEGTPAKATGLAANLIRIGPQSIQSAMSALWVSIQNTARNMLDGVADGRAVWVNQPTPELLAILQCAFTADYKGRLITLLTHKPPTRNGALEVCLGAAVHEYVFTKDLPWPGPKELLAGMEDNIEVLNEVLEAVGSRRNLEYVYWQAEKAKLDRDSFRHGKLRQFSEAIAKDILMVLDPQLHLLSARAQSRTGQIADLVSEALLIKAKLRASPDYYRYRWANSGVALQRAFMEEINKSKGKQEVLWGVSPLIETRATEDEPWTVAVPAKVFTRPWPEHKG